MPTTGLEETERNRVAAEVMYGAAKVGDLETFFSFISPDVVVEEPGFLPYGGTYYGIEGLQKLFATLASEFDLAGLDFERIVADGDYVCAIGKAPLARGGALTFIERIRMREGKVVSLRIYVHEASGLIEAA
jgi:ketosteroid isomerase-like protein